jgi:catechol 2,3-dioxygenase-like lactoylglutathione lyase family enzyme
MTGIETYFHVCYIVPDLEASMEELTNVMGVSWQPARDRESGNMRWRLVYTLDGPPFIELVEGQPGSPWHAPDGPQLHHIGRFTYDLDEGIRQIEAAGGHIETDGREISGRWAYLRVPATQALIELIEADDERRLERYGVGHRIEET